MAATGRGPWRRRAASLLLVVLAVLLGPGATAVAQVTAEERWNLARVGAEEAWTVTRGAGAVVAVVDTGVALDHPDLRDRFVRRDDGTVVGLDLVDGDGDPSDEHGHGTLVAGIIAGAGERATGVAPEASLLPVRVLDAEGAGRSEDVGRGIRWAVDQGAHVVNVSLEAVAPADGDSGPPGVPAAAVRYATDRGVLVVAAAGNRPGAAASYPADTPIVLVGAVDRDDRGTEFSTVDRPDGFVAPGVEIVSTWCRRIPDGCDVTAAPHGQAEGTSFAAPHVSGVAALLVAAGADLAEVRARLAAGAVDLGDPGPDLEHGIGRIDAAASLGVGGHTTSVAAMSAAPPPPPGPAPARPVEDTGPAAAAGIDAAPTSDPPSTVEVPTADDPVSPLATPAADEDVAPAPAPLATGSAVAAPPGRSDVDGWLRLVAIAALAGTMVAWSVAARST